MPRRLPLEPGAELAHLGAARAACRNMLIDVAYVGNRADDLLLFANYNQAAPNNAAGTIPLQDRRPNPGVRRHHLRVQRRQVALQGAAGEVRVAHEPRRHAAELADAVGDEGQRRRSRSRTRTATSRRRRTSATSTPTSGCRTTTSPTTTRPASSGRCRSAPAGAGDRQASPLLDALVGGWQLAGINTVYAGEPVTFTYTPAATVRRLRHRAGFPRRQQLPAERDLRSDGAGQRAHDQQLVQPRLRRRCRPIRASRSATPSATPSAGRSSGSSTWRPRSGSTLGGPAQFEFRLEAFNLLNRTNFRAPNGNRSAGGVRHDHVDLRSAAAAARVEGAVVGSSRRG